MIDVHVFNCKFIKCSVIFTTAKPIHQKQIPPSEECLVEDLVHDTCSSTGPELFC